MNPACRQLAHREHHRLLSICSQTPTRMHRRLTSIWRRTTTSTTRAAGVWRSPTFCCCVCAPFTTAGGICCHAGRRRTSRIGGADGVLTPASPLALFLWNGVQATKGMIGRRRTGTAQMQPSSQSQETGLTRYVWKHSLGLTQAAMATSTRTNCSSRWRAPADVSCLAASETSVRGFDSVMLLVLARRVRMNRAPTRLAHLRLFYFFMRRRSIANEHGAVETGVNRASMELPGVLLGSVVSETCVVYVDETEEGVARGVMC